MRTALFASALCLAVAAVSLPAVAQTTQPTSAPATVPITRVSLFSSGVGFFEHAGLVTGDGSAALRFKTEQINDVLKSLVVQDVDGGNVASVSYQSQDPLDHALHGFQIDLSGSPAIWQMLGQLRGADVVIETSGNKFEGKILGVETRNKAAGDKGTIAVPTLTLLGKSGIQAVAIDEATSIVLSDPTLQEELIKALAAVAGARGSDKRNVTVNFHGTGDRRVRLGYVVETPVWKASYRLTLAGDKPDDKSNLQGWAIVENGSDSDWNHVSLNLVSGRPISFVMNLYDPMYLKRPEAKLDLFAGLTPQTYQEARQQMQLSAAPAPTAEAASFGGVRRDNSYAKGAGTLARGAGGGKPYDANDSVLLPTDDDTSVIAQATAGQIGELFQYALTDVTLARQTSAMVPIINNAIEATPVSIFNASVLERYPLTGARLKNTTGKHLLQGPITVFSAGGYAGDAQINNVPPGQERLISFGVDLATLVNADKVEQTSAIQSVKLVKGVLEVTNKFVSSHTFSMQNKSDKAKTLILEQEKMQGWELVDGEKPVETTDKLYRFEKKLDAKQSADLVVQQQRIFWSQVAMISTDLEALAAYTREGKTPDAVKDAIKKAIDLRHAQADLDQQIGEQNAELKKITDEQTRIRENMKTVDKTSAYYGRLMTKLDAQESTIEKAQTKIGDLTEQRDAKRKELEDYLGSLTVG